MAAWRDPVRGRLRGEEGGTRLPGGGGGGGALIDSRQATAGRLWRIGDSSGPIKLPPVEESCSNTHTGETQAVDTSRPRPATRDPGLGPRTRTAVSRGWFVIARVLGTLPRTTRCASHYTNVKEEISSYIIKNLILPISLRKFRELDLFYFKETNHKHSLFKSNYFFNFLL